MKDFKKYFIIGTNSDALHDTMNGTVTGELTRCKDCVYFTSEKSGEHWNTCRFYDAPKTADGYCNDAERRGEE